jgi:hypothetical protein
MSGTAVWGSGLVVAAIFLLVNSIVLLNGAYQVLTGNRTLILLRRFERHATKRAPATSNDCVLQGAGRILYVVAQCLVAGPMIIPWISSSLELTGAPQLPPLASWPAIADAYFVIFLGCFAIAIVCMIAAFSLRQRVKYVSVDESVTAPGY